MSASITTFAEAEARLAETLPGYESRSEQKALAEAVQDSIRIRTHLLAEAGTGTGKSLGYLIPSILSGQRVIVSTATKALQDQIALKDLPFLQENLGVPFTYAILKGRSNYICGNKALEANPSDVSTLASILKVLDERSEDETFSGEREDFPFEISIRDWMQVASDSDECKTCKHECYAYRARNRAKTSSIVVVNHSLYMTDMFIKDVSRGYASFLGEHDVVVFDEAHELEEYAASALGDEIRQRGIENLLGEVMNFTNQYDKDRITEAGQITQGVRKMTAALWETLEEGRIRANDLLDREDEFVGLANSLIDLFDFMEPWYMTQWSRSTPENKKKGARAARKVEVAAERVRTFVTAPFTNIVRWVETDTTRKGENFSILKYAPIDVSPYLRRMIFDTGVTAVLTSATLAVNEGMTYIAGRLGIDEYEEIDVGTPFDYPSQARLYVPTDLPDPSREKAAWSSLSISRMMDLVKKSEGRALLLFTSYTEMRNAYETISANVPYNCMMQGQRGNKALAQEFKDDETSVLFATRSFMTGVDFQGDTLKLVVINKLPFPVPTEPITEARCEAIKARGGSDFVEYSVPVMTLVLKQAFGRLIRTKRDTGVVAILDPRLEKKGYGKKIQRALPDAPVVTSMDDVESFLATERVPA